VILQAVINWSRSILPTPAVHFIVCWLPSTSKGRYSHPIACCFLILLRPVSCTFFHCTSWAIFLVAAIAGLWWTNWCLDCCCVAARGASIEAPVVQLDLESVTPGWGVCRAMTCSYGNG
jgi:hypothetical protein